VAGAAGFVVLLALCTMERHTSVMLHATRSNSTEFEWPQREGVETRLTVADLRAAAARPDGDRTVARAILDRSPPTSENTVLELGASFSSPLRSEHTSLGWPIDWLWTNTQNYDRGARSTIREPVRWHWSRGSPVMLHTWTSDGTRVKTYGVNLDGVAVLFLSLWLPFQAGRLLVRFVAWRTVFRRLRRGLCVVCAYDLSGLLVDRTRE
jgi:hypothetical protein